MRLRATAVILLAWIILLSICFLSQTVMADMCVLKGGEYPGDYSGVKVCTEADKADGAEDDTIEIEFYPGEDIEIDVVYQQEEVKYQLDFFLYMLFYDSTNMTMPITCNLDPSNYFGTHYTSQRNLITCAYDERFGYAKDTKGSRVIRGVATNGIGRFPSDGNEPDTFVLDQITFTNEFYTEDDTFEYFAFSTVGGAPTDVAAYINGGYLCPLFFLSYQCSEIGITTPQKLLKTKVSIVAPPCYAGTPSVEIPTCKGLEGCTTDAGSADYSFSYTVPTTCYKDSSCSETSDLCGDYSVVISDGTDTYEESDGVYTETKSVRNVVSGYSIYGRSDGCLGSNNLSCSGSETGIVEVSPVICICGDPPVVTLEDEDKYGEGGSGRWYNKHDIEIAFSLTDADADKGSGLPGSVPTIKLYFTNDGGQTTNMYDVNANTRTMLDSSGDFSAIINGEWYVRNDVDIYFGMIARDEDGNFGAYPLGFRCWNDTACDWSDSSKYVLIPGDNITNATSLSFVEQPFPNMFPFRPGPDSLMKIYFSMSGESEVIMRIYSMDGRLIRKIFSDTSRSVDSSLSRADCMGKECNFCNFTSGCSWDGTTKKGGYDFVQNGMYVVHIIAAGTGNLYGQNIEFTKAVVVMK